MADLKFDTVAMTNSSKQYETTAKNMMELREKLQTSIENLTAIYWKSDAGKAFEDLYTDGWASNVEKYVGVLNELAVILANAAKKYEQLAEKADRVKIDQI